MSSALRYLVKLIKQQSPFGVEEINAPLGAGLKIAADGSIVASGGDGGGGTTDPAGIDTQVQINDNNNFGVGDLPASLNKTTGDLTVQGKVTAGVSGSNKTVWTPNATPTGTRVFTTPDANSNSVIPDAGASNQFLTSISSGGVIGKAQPTGSNLSMSDVTVNNVTSSLHGFAPKAPADATKFLNGATTPDYAAVKDSDLSMADVTTNNASTSSHGFLRKSPNDATKFLNGASAPDYAAVKDSDLSLSDVTTNNASTSAHGFLKKLDNSASSFMNGQGNWAAGGGATEFSEPGLRLTLESGVPVSTTDQTAKGTLYWTPYTSGQVVYWSGSAWVSEFISEQSLSLTITSGKNYDVFYLHGTGLVLSSAWTNDTTRADALGTQNGVGVLSGDATKLWIGTIRASGSNVTEDSFGGASQAGGKRFVWNVYNQINRSIGVIDTTDSWTWNSATWHSANAASGNKVEYVVGRANSLVNAHVRAVADVIGDGANANAASPGIGVDSTSSNSALVRDEAAGGTTLIGLVRLGADALYSGYPGLGYHAISWLEYNRTGASNATTWRGDLGVANMQSGMFCYLWN